MSRLSAPAQSLATSLPQEYVRLYSLYMAHIIKTETVEPSVAQTFTCSACEKTIRLSNRKRHLTNCRFRKVEQQGSSGNHKNNSPLPRIPPTLENRKPIVFTRPISGTLTPSPDTNKISDTVTIRGMPHRLPTKVPVPNSESARFDLVLKPHGIPSASYGNPNILPNGSLTEDSAPAVVLESGQIIYAKQDDGFQEFTPTYNKHSSVLIPVSGKCTCTPTTNSYGGKKHDITCSISSPPPPSEIVNSFEGFNLEAFTFSPELMQRLQQNSVQDSATDLDTDLSKNLKQDTSNTRTSTPPLTEHEKVDLRQSSLNDNITYAQNPENYFSSSRPEWNFSDSETE